ncbi:Phosphoribosylformylglycinamidine synthase subunit PurL [Candidatus Gugararchaeum adminiculabundum]|nr:Phosphoribosylformylglycinamidine synthase subunit PurL [Candidatus Gugararchaeum adminiculabundum]
MNEKKSEEKENAAEPGTSLTPDEQKEVRKRLGREPNALELGMIDIMWSEHCSYKSSRPILKMLPTTGGAVVVGPGYDAGVIDIGGGWCAAFKIETHNHPSAIDPYNGAATGIGGIVRDILSMGARPVALFDSIHFGSLSSPHSRWLLRNVVKGIGDYGNCIGVPTVGGELQFDEGFERNCLVNAACLGFVRKDKIMKSDTAGEGDHIILAGGSTGRDGIHGVTFASKNLSMESEGERPAVQVGDPFTKKLLIDATLELLEAGLLKSLKDLGGGGLTCASSELAFKSGGGADIDISKIHLREKGMSPYEIMLSESQERMLYIADDARKAGVIAILEKYGIRYAEIGKITKGNYRVLDEKGKVLAEMKASLLTEAPTVDRPTKELKFEGKCMKLNKDISFALGQLMASENLCSRSWIYEQYDHEVGDRTVGKPGHDSAVLLAPNGGAVVVKLDSDSLWCNIDPYKGSAGVVCEAYRNVVSCGGKPLACVDNLSFGNPEKPEVMFQFKESVRGISDALKALETPCVGGNVSFYNEDEETKLSIKPTPVIMMVGVIDSLKKLRKCRMNKGEKLVLVGETRAEIGGSEYCRTILGAHCGVLPEPDLAAEKRNGEFVLANWENINAVHDVSRGGIAYALLEMCVQADMGAKITLDPIPMSGKEHVREEDIVFSETHGRYIIATKKAEELLAAAAKAGVPAAEIGIVGGGKIEIDAYQFKLQDMKEGYGKALWKAMEHNKV